MRHTEKERVRERESGGGEESACEKEKEITRMRKRGGEIMREVGKRGRARSKREMIRQLNGCSDNTNGGGGREGREGRGRRVVITQRQEGAGGDR